MTDNVLDSGSHIRMQIRTFGQLLDRFAGRFRAINVVHYRVESFTVGYQPIEHPTRIRASQNIVDP
ncbi:hypothetical protein [Nocardia jiangxiensis]|uniref:Uncharacterized protein n=1 Tax=Nocardia jiangxiensis TaxID=282685 RepID=A0ABW6RVG1_9NOCA|nr:hypothetical protein [Nocardia jiangxiensis]